MNAVLAIITGGGLAIVVIYREAVETNYFLIYFIIICLLEESARANPDARIRPLTHVSVDRAYQAKSVGSNSLLSTLIAICRSPIYE